MQFAHAAGEAVLAGGERVEQSGRDQHVVGGAMRLESLGKAGREVEVLDKSAKRARGQGRHQHTSEPQRVQDRVGVPAGQLAAKDIEIDVDIVSHDDDLVGQEPGARSRVTGSRIASKVG